MYINPLFNETNQSRLFELIEAYSFATLIALNPNNPDNPEISHLPLLVDQASNQLLGHLAKVNPLYKLIEQQVEVKVIFHGPHDYISPSWYTDPKNNVPTWNYAVVHVSGTIKSVDQADLVKLLDQLQQKHDPHNLLNWNSPRINNMLLAIGGFKIDIKQITGKFKLSQNQSSENQNNVIHHLTALNPELAQLMQENHK